MPTTPLINGRSWAWADINVSLLGRTVYGITAIDYSDKQDITNNYGSGAMPISRGYGKYEAEAKITLEAKEVDRIAAAIPGGRLQDIPPFPVTVAFVNSANLAVTHKLMNCQFKSNKRASKAGDTTIDVELDLVVSHIEWN